MKISLLKPFTTPASCDLLLVGTFSAQAAAKKNAKASSEGFEVSSVIKELDQQVDGHLATSATAEGFSGACGQAFVLSSLGNSKAKSLGLVGLGNPNEQSLDGFRKSGGEAYRLAQRKRASKLTYVVPQKTTIPLFDVVQAVAEGALLAGYSFDKYHTKNKNVVYVNEMEICLPSDPTSDHKLALKRAEIIAAEVSLARDLVNQGPSDLTPAQLAKYAQDGAKDAELSIKVLDEKELKKEGMGLLLAVANAASSVAPPRLIRLHYKPKKSSGKKIALLGKGVTFDSGGLDIKPADGMLDMKVDMSGAAAVLSAMFIIGKIKPKVEVIGYMACVENGIGSEAYHPGDVIMAKNGLSVEISNTDAEGRLILADTITYTLKHDKPDVIIDIATLTGACVVALGPKVAGLFSNDDNLASTLAACGKVAGEEYWRLPLEQELKESLKSDIADLKNCGDRWGGAITAALFLEEFVGKDTKWAHLDIAGPATNKKAHAYLPKGGTGFAVRTLVNYLMAQE